MTPSAHDRVEVILVVRVEAREHDVRTETIHRQRRGAGRREARVEVGERRLADREHRIAVGERGVRAGIAGILADCSGASARDRTGRGEHRRRAPRRATRPRDRRRRARMTGCSRRRLRARRRVARRAARRARPSRGADSTSPSASRRVCDQREPGLLALGDEPSVRIDDHPLAVAGCSAGPRRRRAPAPRPGRAKRRCRDSPSPG